MNAEATPKPPRVALVAITKHGAATVQRLASELPAADVIVSDKFSGSLTSLGNRVLPYTGALNAQMANLFSAYDQIVFFVSLGAVVRLIAPHVK